MLAMKPKVTDDVCNTISVIGYNYIVKMIEMKFYLLSFLHLYNRLLGYLGLTSIEELGKLHYLHVSCRISTLSHDSENLMVYVILPL